MFYYFSPRCRVDGSLMVDGAWQDVADGSGWYDHEFGDHQRAGRGYQATVGWNWLAAQLDNGCAHQRVRLFDRGNTARSRGRWVIVTSRSGERHAYDDFTLTGDTHWTSAKTFNEYPTRYRLEVPRAGIVLDIDAALLRRRWSPSSRRRASGRDASACAARVAARWSPVSASSSAAASAWSIRRTNSWRPSGARRRRAIDELLPERSDPRTGARSDQRTGRDHLLNGVDLDQFSRTLMCPIREMILRGGKTWRSYGVLACMDAVGGDSQPFLHWLALPELLHVGSMIVDDVQDHSDIRRGGPALHRLYGEALAINVGCASYFLAQVPVGASRSRRRGSRGDLRGLLRGDARRAHRAGVRHRRFRAPHARGRRERRRRAARAAHAGRSPLEVRGAAGRARAHGRADRRWHGRRRSTHWADCSRRSASPSRSSTTC